MDVPAYWLQRMAPNTNNTPVGKSESRTSKYSEELLMAEQEVPVKTMGVIYVCDVCRNGSMTRTKAQLIVDDTKEQLLYEHQCSNDSCRAVQTFPEVYPTVRHRIVTEE
jgi:hypothetical protein